ncbi:MAG: putative transposase [Halopseudomonas sp.]|jgi:putative transposase
MCRVLRVARAGLCQWEHKPVSDREQENRRTLQLIRNSYAASSGVYGALLVFGDLREAGETCSKHSVARLMRTHKIRALKGHKAPRPIAGRPSSSLPTVSTENSTSMPLTKPG